MTAIKKQHKEFDMQMAFELGYKAHERGDNLDMAKQKFVRMLERKICVCGTELEIGSDTDTGMCKKCRKKFGYKW